jgi:hypothetical protein
MSDEENKNKYAHLNPTQMVKAELAAEKIRAAAKVRELSKGKDWTILQDIAQDIIANHTVKDPNSRAEIAEVRRQLITEVEYRYQNEPELKQVLLDGIPSADSMMAWTKKEGWEQAVWKKIHETGLFSKERRAAMINALFTRGLEKDTTAAKIWLTLSGDYIEKSQVDNKDATVERFREINSILHKSKKES